MKMTLNKKQAKPIIEKTFPDYNGRKFKIEFVARITFYDTNWSGGTKNTYAFIRADGLTEVLKNIPSPFNNPLEGYSTELPLNVMVVKHSYFCGHDMGITIYANPKYCPKWLTE